MKKIISILTLLLSFILTSTAALADDTTIIVTPDDMATSLADVIEDPTSWFFYNDETDVIDNTLGIFVLGPSTPPLGESSIEISVSGTQRRNLATYQFVGVPLEEITSLAFSTYNPSVGNAGSSDRSGYLHFNVDFDGDDDWQSRLVFVPSDNGTVLQDTWQEWDTIGDGSTLWRYSGAVWPDTGLPGLSTTRTWNEILEAFPGVRTRESDPWLGVRVGEPYADGYTENLDAFKFGTADGTTTFDFEKFYPTTGEITYPAEDGDIVSGLVTLMATYDDGDDLNDDPVNWAVREGTCAAATDTRFGNVDGFSDPYIWDGSDFSAEIDTSTLIPGQWYCFVFNPTDDPGQNDVRVTREFFYIFDVSDMWKNSVLWESSVGGQGILTAPGLMKPFNPNSMAVENAGKKK